jgi:CRISPR-associated protein Csd1
MLHQVVEYAQRQKLAAEPGFAPKYAKWAILCTASGKYLGLVEIGDTSSKKNPGRHFSKAPDLNQGKMKAGGVTKSHFLIDTAAVVAGYGKDAPEEKRRYFIGLLEQAREAMPVLGAAAEMLRNEGDVAALGSDLERRKAKATDKVTFQIDGQFPVEADEWHDWWREFHAGLQTSKEQGRKAKNAKMLCFLTGELVEPAATHPKITGLTGVGGLAMGDVLIGFKQESFRSYGLEQSANAAMSELAAKGYQSGLNDLIANRSVSLAGTLVTHWFRDRIALEDDPMDWFIQGTSEGDELNAQIRARKLLKSIKSGERADLASNTYYALTISSNGGRVVIRDWMEGRFAELAANVVQWFSDLEIVHRDGGGSAKPPKFGAVLAALVRELKDVAAPMAVKLYRVAARGEPIPLAAMAQALARVRVDVIQGERPNHARMGLIKAYHLRKRKQEGGSMDGQLKPEVNADLRNRAYHCGRLMAVLAGIQAEALPGVKAGVIQRYYAAASTTPALVFGRLVRGAQPHLKLISDQKEWLKDWFERQMSEICAEIGTSMPKTLSLEDQSMFALGYYQQLAARWAGKDTNKEQDEKGDE